MDALTLLQEKIDAHKVLEHYDFDKVRPDGIMVRSCCKIHGGNNPTAFVMNAETGVWYCHTGDCGGGDIFTLVEKMEGISFPEAVRFVARLFDVDIKDLQITERKKSYMKEMKAWIKAMQSRKKKELVEFSIEEEVKEVARFRNFSEDTLRHFQVGWVESVKLEKKEKDKHGNTQFYTLKNRLVFPVYQHGLRVGYSFRRVSSKDVPKWSHQPPNLNTGDLLYNYDEAKNASEIIVVEGLPDAMAFHEIGVTPVATLGAHLTDEQYKLLMRTGADITLAYDGDEAGQLATQKAIEMFKYKVNLRVIDFAPNEDPDNISREELKKRYDARRKV